MALVFNVFSFEIRRQLLKLILFEVSRRFVGGYTSKLTRKNVFTQGKCTSIRQVSAAVSLKQREHLQCLLFFLKVTLLWTMNYRIMLCYFLFAVSNAFSSDIYENVNTVLFPFSLGCAPIFVNTNTGR